MTAENIGDFGDESADFGGGDGFRYLVAGQLGLRADLHIVVGTEDTFLYKNIGSALTL